MKVAFHASSSIGRCRAVNEDRWWVAPSWSVVADGCGAGGLVAEWAVDGLRTGLGDLSGYSASRLRDRLISGSESVPMRVAAEPSAYACGASVMVAALGDSTLAIAHVGDCRAYRMRDGVLERLTREHSLSDEFGPNFSTAVSQSFGWNPINPDAVEVPVRSGDIVMLCTDGVWRLVSDAELLSIIRAAGPDPEVIAKRVAEQAEHNGGHDNATCVVGYFG